MASQASAATRVQLPQTQEVSRPPRLHSSWQERLSLVGLSMFVFAVVALSSPGRIDVIDGQTRYEVGRSFVEHGDSIVRDADAWFAVFSGRNGERYSNYRFPHSVLAAAAILVADATGPVREIRRHFFFSLSGAVLCAAITLLYACWFRRIGHGGAASLAWAAGGVFCTPTWFYGTTTFDDVLGALVLLLAVYSAWALGARRPVAGAVASGLLLGLAFNCKPPLALFMLVAAAALWDPRRAPSERWRPIRVMFLCMASGVIVYQAYDLWKFPPSTWAKLAEAREEYVSLWPGSPLAGFLSLLISPGIGALWYWPAVVVALYGLVVWRRTVGQAFQPGLACTSHPSVAGFVRSRAGAADVGQNSHEFCYALRAVLAGTGEKCGLGRGGAKLFSTMMALSCLAFLLFIGSIRFFSGEPAWGPRYLTPAFALLWVFVPAGAARLRWPIAGSLIAVSFLLQVAGLSIDTMRFYCDGNAPAADSFLKDPWTYFHLGRSQLIGRSRQLYEVATYDGPPAKVFSRAKKPSLPLISLTFTEPLSAKRNHVLNTFWPWWCTYWYLPADARPVDLILALKLLLIAGEIGAGLLLVFGGSRIRENSGRSAPDFPLQIKTISDIPQASRESARLLPGQ